MMPACLASTHCWCSAEQKWRFGPLLFGMAIRASLSCWGKFSIVPLANGCHAVVLVREDPAMLASWEDVKMRQLCGRLLLIFSVKFITTPLIVGRLSSWVTWFIFCTFSSVVVEYRRPETSKTKPKFGQFVGFCWTHGFIMDTLLKHFINNRIWFLWTNIKLAAKSEISLVYEDHSTHPAQTHLHVICKNTKFLRGVHYCNL
jgi:hypothetical protein